MPTTTSVVSWRRKPITTRVGRLTFTCSLKFNTSLFLNALQGGRHVTGPVATGPSGIIKMRMATWPDPPVAKNNSSRLIDSRALSVVESTEPRAWKLASSENSRKLLKERARLSPHFHRRGWPAKPVMWLLFCQNLFMEHSEEPARKL